MVYNINVDINSFMFSSICVATKEQEPQPLGVVVFCAGLRGQ
jgi:hypothetical protein